MAGGHHPPTSRLLLDRAVTTLGEHRDRWLSVSLTDKVAHLRTLVRRTMEVAPAFIEDALAAKGFDPSLAGEDWVATVITQVRTMRILADTMEAIERTGRAPAPDKDVRVRSNGQVALRVVPDNSYDRMLYMGFKGEVWLDPAIERADLDQHLGGIYTKPHLARPGTALALGAGNVASIAVLDVVYKLFVEGKVVLLKYSGVNDYIGRHVEEVFADLISAGYLRTAYGGADVGTYLVHHQGIEPGDRDARALERARPALSCRERGHPDAQQRRVQLQCRRSAGAPRRVAAAGCLPGSVAPGVARLPGAARLLPGRRGALRAVHRIAR